MTTLTKHETVWLQAFTATISALGANRSDSISVADYALKQFQDRFPPSPPPQNPCPKMDYGPPMVRIVTEETQSKIEGVYVTREMLAKPIHVREVTPCANCEKLEAEFRSAKNAGCDATCLNYRDGDEEIQRLQKQLEMCIEVLEWYSSDEAHGAGELVWKKTQYVSDGGKRARECLAKLEKE